MPAQRRIQVANPGLPQLQSNAELRPRWGGKADPTDARRPDLAAPLDALYVNRVIRFLNLNLADKKKALGRNSSAFSCSQNFFYFAVA